MYTYVYLGMSLDLALTQIAHTESYIKVQESALSKLELLINKGNTDSLKIPTGTNLFMIMQVHPVLINKEKSLV